MSSTLVIYNPIAGRGRVNAHWPEVRKALHEAGVDFDAVPTRAPFEAIRLAEKAAQKYDVVVAVGGDGTVHEVANGLLRASGEGETIAMGVIPLGNGDDFAKMIPPEVAIGGSLFDWRAAVDKIARGQTKLFDVGRISGDGLRPELEEGPHYFANSMDVGFGAYGARYVETIPKFLTGFAAYLATVLKTLIDYPNLYVRIQLDDQPPFEQGTTMTAVMNGRCFANGFWVCPDALADDGIFDLMVAEVVGRLTIMRLVPKIMRGTHIDDPVVSMYRACRVVIESDEPLVVEADGEIPYIEAHRLEIENLPGRLRVFT